MRRTGPRSAFAVCVAIAVASAAASIAHPSFADDAPPKKDDASMPVHVAPAATAVERGAFPKSFEFPGTGVSFSLVGYAKVDFIHDFESMGNHDQFKTNTIAIDGTAAADLEGQTTVHARETRIGLDIRKSEDHLRVYVEGDFFADNNAFRMRHAYGELGNILGGQTWTTFMDISVRPRIVDYEGPDGEILSRRGMIRAHRNFSDLVSAAVAVEHPTPQIAVPGTLTGVIRSIAPEIPAYVRLENERGHVQVAGIWRQLRFDGQAGSSDESATGWGLSGTFKAKVAAASELEGQLAHGEGIAALISGFNGLNADAVFDAGGDLDPLPATSFFLGFAHHFSPKVTASLVYSQADLDAAATQPTTTITELQDVRANLWWRVHGQVDYAVAVLWGRVEERSGASGENVRLQLAAKYAFN